MGRMLDSLKHTDKTATPPEGPVLAAVCPEPEAPPEPADGLEMPFVEVGEPRRPVPPKPRREFAGLLRGAALHLEPPMTVRLEPGAKSSPRPDAELIAFHQPEHAVSAQYSALFAQIAPEASEDLAPVLLFTSLMAGAGTTSVLLNLAICGCRHHRRRIVVVDVNRTRPAAARRLGLTPPIGLHEVLQGRAALEQAVLETPQCDLRVLSPGDSADGSPWPADAVRWALAWLRQRFDLVMVDAPAWQDGGDLRTLTPLASAVYLVVDGEDAQRPQVRTVARGVKQVGSRLGGLIVTQ